MCRMKAEASLRNELSVAFESSWKREPTPAMRITLLTVAKKRVGCRSIVVPASKIWYCIGAAMAGHTRRSRKKPPSAVYLRWFGCQGRVC